MHMTKLPKRHQRGLGLVELMVGITVGLIVAAGASMVAVNQINEHRRLMLETQLQQDLRIAADLLQQDLRRAGSRFYSGPELSVWGPAKAVGSLAEQAPQLPSPNPYSAFAVSKSDSVVATTVVSYLYSRLDDSGQPNSSNVPTGNEHFGFRWVPGSGTSSGVLYLQLGVGADGQPNWQPITDPESVNIRDFRITPSEQTISLGDFCDQACGHSGEPSCPTQVVREIKFKIVGQAKRDTNVVRTLTGTERIRADAIVGTCPS